MSAAAIQARLVGDIGGTHARFAYQAAPGEALRFVSRFDCASFAGLAEALLHFLAQHGLAMPRELALGVATPVQGDQLRFVNNHWRFSIEALRAQLGLRRLLVLNDFAALALSLPTLGSAELEPLGAGTALAGATQLCLGPGTGLGVAALLHEGSGGLRVLASEGGHASLAAGNAREAELLELLRKRFGHASAERALSGPGLANLYAALAEQEGGRPCELSPAEIVARARAGSDARALQACQVFVDLLGGFAGSLALTFGASGGVYLGGGVLDHFGPLLDHARFRARFEAKGRFREHLAGLPCWRIVAPHAALRGAINALDQP
ncbi:glucokinase [Paucibacter soli]|uniref:glucokinase n=1 Tax=Paucibacter soli TaxID=3133433 RepID=UPI00309E73D1